MIFGKLGTIGTDFLIKQTDDYQTYRRGSFIGGGNVKIILSPSTDNNHKK